MKRILGTFAALVGFFSLTVSAQSLEGKWTGFSTSPQGGTGTLEITLTRSSQGLSGDLILRLNNREESSRIELFSPPPGGETIAFSALVQGATLSFRARLVGEKLTGAYDVVFSGSTVASPSFCLSKSPANPCRPEELSIPTEVVPAQQGAKDFDPSVAEPAYKTGGPLVLFDEGHRNFHTSKGTYKPFVDLIAADGYRIRVNSGIITEESLKDVALFVAANARGSAIGQSAFSEDEIKILVDWVRSGGSIFLIADHAPAGAYASKLSSAFGVEMSTGTTVDLQNVDPVIQNLLFSRENKLLADHAITRGRNEKESVRRVVSFTGQSLRTKEGTAILVLGDTAVDKFPGKSDISAKGGAQAVAVKIGKGRVFISGEAAMHTAQTLAGGAKFGMNVSGIDNRQYTLNIMHWLTRLID